MNSRAVFLSTIAVAVATGCTTPRHPASAKAACCEIVEPTAVPLPDLSLYHVESIWTDDAGKPVRLGALRGRPRIVVMFFASCAYACPILVRDLKRIEGALPEQARSQAGFVLVSFDSERDTAPALAQFRDRFGLTAGQWTLLTGRPDDVRELAAVLGVKYKQDASGQFSHSNIITVLNSEGEIVHQQLGLNQSIDETVAAIQGGHSKSQIPNSN